MKFNIFTLGCKVNAYESEMMKEKLLANNYQYDETRPDIIIINTCSVTNIADQKSRKMVRHFKKEHPDAILVVAGCSSFHKQEEYQSLGIDILLGNTDKSKVVELINEFIQSKTPIVKFNNSRKLPFEDMQVEKFTTHTRAFIKIQDGCDNFCSYCVIPFVRGSIRSKEFKTTLKETELLVQNGHQEIVLTGIHTGSYGVGTEHDLTDLIHEMSEIEDLKRIRISSIEITELNDKFLQELKMNPKICNHLHIPLQAGSDEILIKMNRKYRLDDFEKKLKQIREIRPDISITTDIIVGHPHETEELFKKTLETAEKFGFSKIHVFPYSKREGTVSAKMPCQIEEKEKHNRSKKLNELSKKLEIEYAEKFMGKELEILVEKSDDISVGFTSNYLKVILNTKVPKNSFVKVMITNIRDGKIYGELKKLIYN